MVQSISVESIDTDQDETIGTEMCNSIQRWLDAEWMPQQIHYDIGMSAKASYLSCRNNNEHDLMAIMVQVADDLEKEWYDKYDADAFVGNWDIANYVSDYLTKLTGSEQCECSSKIY